MPDADAKRRLEDGTRQHARIGRITERSSTPTPFAARSGATAGTRVQHYTASSLLGDALRQDVAARFTPAGSTSDSRAITTVVVDFLDRAAEARNLPRFTKAR